MQNQLNKVKDFHEAFLVENGKPLSLLPESEFILRHKLMEEENKEYLEACWKGDITEIADALGDQLYILCGTILKHGLQHKIEEVFEEIHKSNMSKLGEDGKPVFREDGKIMKGPGYFRPKIDMVLMSTNMGIDHCPHCGAINDRATPVQNEGAVPIPGDFSVCIKCAGINKFGEDMALEKLSHEEFESLPFDVKTDLLKAMLKIQELHKS